MRNVFKLKMTHKFAEKHFNYFPKGGFLKRRSSIVEIKTVVDRIEWWQTELESKEVYDVLHNKDDPVTIKHNGALWVQYKGMRCLATDFIGFLKYGRWFCYEPRDGDYCNLKWENLKRS